MALERAEIIARLKATLDRERLDHSLRVEQIALRLAKKWGVDARQVSLAALLHDCARRYSRHELLVIAGKIGLRIDPIREFEPKLFHAEISASLARQEFGIRDQTVLQAIRRHTVGAKKMSHLDKIIYLSDHLEEGREYSWVARLRQLAFRDLDKAVVASTTQMIRYLLENGLPIYPRTVETRNSYLMGKDK